MPSIRKSIKTALTIIVVFNTAFFTSPSSAKLSAILYLLLDGNLDSDLGWGADPVSMNHRPAQSWVGAFSSAPIVSTQSDVNGNTAIEDALDQCDISAGQNNYCNIHLTQNIVLSDSVYINRSKTRIFSTTATSVSHNSVGVFFQIDSNTSEIVIESLELNGQSQIKSETFGIVIDGENISRILIRDNHIHHFHATENAHAIAVFGRGTDENSAIKNIVIDNNNVHNMKTGSSESIAVNGNVTNWQISTNRVTDVNNIAIDAIGGEGTAPPITNTNRVLPSIVDAARYGFIENNTVTRMSTYTNPAYGNKHSWAAAIYIDGGRYIHLSGNTVIDTPWGFEIGAENCVTSKHITLDNNKTQGSWNGTNLYRYGDLLVGGYASKGYKNDSNIECNPLISNDADEGHGHVSHITVGSSDFSSSASDAGLDPVTFQYRATSAVVIGLGIDTINANGNGSAPGDQNAIRDYL